jgi:signal transduction histidine kinase
MQKPPQYRAWISAGLTCAVGLTMTLLLTLTVRQVEHARAVQQVNQAANLRFLNIESDVEEAIDAVYGLHSLFAVVDSVTREQFTLFSKPVLSRYPYIRSLNYRVFIQHTERAEFEARMRNTYPHFTITDRDFEGNLTPATAHQTYLVNYYVEPYREHEESLGYNSLSNPRFAAALERARDTGLPSATSWVRAIVGNDLQPGLLIFLPIYRYGVPVASLEARREHLVGYVAAVVRASDMLREIMSNPELNDSQPMDLRIYDAPRPDPETQIFGPDLPPAKPAPWYGAWFDEQPVVSKNIRFADRIWHLVATPVAKERALLAPRGSRIVLVSGLLLSLLLSAYVYNLSGQSIRIRAIVNQRTEALRQFVADVAHEVRTPLSALQLHLQIFERSEDSGQKSAALAEMKKGLLRTVHLVQQLLTLARLEPEAISTSFSALRLDALVKNIIVDYTTQAEASSIDLGLKQHMPVTVVGDDSLLRILIGNLIDNAIRYAGPGGRIDVTVRADGLQAFIEVDDTGPGIPAEHLPKVFNRFYRVPGRSAAGGSGLGLAIVRRIAALHDGKVELANLAGGGLRAVVTLGAVPPEPVAKAAPSGGNHFSNS